MAASALGCERARRCWCRGWPDQPAAIAAHAAAAHAAAAHAAATTTQQPSATCTATANTAAEPLVAAAEPLAAAAEPLAAAALALAAALSPTVHVHE